LSLICVPGGDNVPEIKPAILEGLVNLIVHDLRNPAATLGANLSFVDEVLDDASVEREEIRDALRDAQQGLYDLQKGLDQIAWIGRWSNGKPAASSSVEDLSATLARLSARVRYGALEIERPVPTVRVRGGEALERLLELLVANGHQHAPRTVVKVRALREGEHVVLEVEDQGKPLAPELHELAFSLEGQTEVKSRSEGRYSRVAGLFSASVLAQALEAGLHAIERNRNNVFRVVLTQA
jgi:signal transduction histidine kinase